MLNCETRALLAHSGSTGSFVGDKLATARTDVGVIPLEGGGVRTKILGRPPAVQAQLGQLEDVLGDC